MSDSKITYFQDLLLKEGDNALLKAKYLSISVDEVITAYINLNLPEPLMILQNTWLPRTIGLGHGWGNGYVRICEGHKLYGKTYDDIDISVHGGLTFGEHIKDNNTFSDGYWIGFDTAHHSDNLQRWPKESVLSETKDLFAQVYHLK